MSEPNEAQVKILNDCLDKLGEFYDSVHIFATRHEPENEGQTLSSNKGRGNWFSRYGQVREWLIREEETTRINTRKDNE